MPTAANELSQIAMATLGSFESKALANFEHAANYAVGISRGEREIHIGLRA